MATPRGLFWVDLETTGLDLERDEILEIAVVLTDFELTEIDRWESVITMTPNGAARIAADPYVMKMHADNGLYRESRDANVPLAVAEESLVQFLEHADFLRGELIIAGSGVASFDRPLIRKHLPRVDEFLTYYPADIGVIRRLLPILSAGTLELPKVPASFMDGYKTHRAMDDVQAHILEASVASEYLQRLAFLSGTDELTKDS